MKIVFDVDGVLANFTRGYSGLANEMFGVPTWDNHEVTSWDYSPGLNREQESKIWEKIKNSSTFWYDLSPLATHGERIRIYDIVSEHDVYFATNRPGVRTKDQTEDWLNKYIGIYPTVVVTSRKGEFAKVIEADSVIDDKAGNAVAVQYISPKTTSYLLDRLYNRFDQTVVGTKVVRVSSVTEFLDKIDNKVTV